MIQDARERDSRDWGLFELMRRNWQLGSVSGAWCPGGGQVRAGEDSAPQSSHSAALRSHSLRLSFGCVVQRRPSWVVSKGRRRTRRSKSQAYFDRRLCVVAPVQIADAAAVRDAAAQAAPGGWHRVEICVVG